MFNVTDNKGFQIEFKNGYSVSCQFGTMNYCSRRSFDMEQLFCERKMGVVMSEDCEVAIIKDRAIFVTGAILEKMGLDIGGDGMVCGYVSADNVAKIIAYVSAINEEEQR